MRLLFAALLLSACRPEHDCEQLAVVYCKARFRCEYAGVAISGDLLRCLREISVTPNADATACIDERHVIQGLDCIDFRAYLQLHLTQH